MTTPTTTGITDSAPVNGFAPVRIHHPSTVGNPVVDATTNSTRPSTTDGPQSTTTPDTTTPDTTTPDTQAEKAHRPWPLLIIGLAAAVAVWSGWVGLGQLAGFGVIHPLPGIWDQLRINTAVVLPLSVEAYAAYALRVWLGTNTHHTRTLRFAKRSAIASMIIGAMAQVAYHLMSAAGYTHAPWPVVTLVATVPVIVLGLASALAKLVTSDQDK